MSLNQRVVGGLLILLSSIVWTVIMPGCVAAWGGVFYEGSMRNHLPATASQQLSAYSSARAEITSRLSEVTQQIPTVAAAGGDIKAFLNYRDSLSTQLDQLKPPVYVIPFHLNPQLLLWPAIYTVLGWIIFFFPPDSIAFAARRSLTRSILRNGVLIYAAYEWPLWFRNFVLSNDGRTVFAFTNADINLPSFIAQELVILGYSILTSYVWTTWIRAYEVSSKADAIFESQDAYAAVTTNFAERVGKQFVTWQVMSVLLALGYLFFTNFFWRFVTVYHDQRYLLSAILAHALWAVTWLLISMPVLSGWTSWSRVERRLRADLITSDIPSDEKTIRSDLLDEIKPMNAAGISLSGAVSFISFVGPIAHAFL